MTELETQLCLLCEGPLIKGECPSYSWNDSIHLRNRARVDPKSHWGKLFHSKAEAMNAPPVEFLIKGFLQREGVTAIAAPVRERKSLIALNIVHSLLTGEKLFGHFEVVKRPDCVIYLCPEVSLGPFTDRVRKIGLLDYVGEKFFYRTLSAEGTLKLDDDGLKACIPGSVVFLDTAIRFLQGDESSSQDARMFADSIFALMRGGAESVVMLHHSPKDAGDVMTLENCMRGSGDLGAFLACCWGTRLQDPQRPYESRSYLENLKQRDFESQPFEVTCDADCRMRIASDPAATVTLQTRRGNKGNKDGKDVAAKAVIRANLSTSARDLEVKLAEVGIDRRKTWIAKAQARIKAEMGISGVQVKAG
jgi:AAA domain